MKLSDSERLIVLMLSDLHRHLMVSGTMDAGLVAKLVYEENEWALAWKYDCFTSRAGEPAEVNETAKILDMWWTIETSIEALPDHDKEEVERLCREVSFRGFDGWGKHYAIAMVLVFDLGRYQRFKGRNLRAVGCAPIEHQKARLARFDKCLRTLPIGEHMSPGNIVYVINGD